MKLNYTFFLLAFVCFKASAQVNLQTGAINYSVPLLEYNSPQKDLATALTLVYNGGNGIKVNEIASEVGLGWDLSVGGVITRKQNGLPDDQKRTNGINYTPWFGYSNMWVSPGDGVHTNKELFEKVYGDGYIFNNYDPQVPLSPSVAYAPLYLYDAGYQPSMDLIADREQDEFSFTFNGRKGKFVIGKDKTIKCLTNSRLIIESAMEDMTALNIRTQIKSFTITDELGIKYIFKDNNLSQLCKYDSAKTLLFNDNGTPVNNKTIPEYMGNTSSSVYPQVNYYDASAVDQFIIDKWYLTEILNPSINEKIKFSYDVINVDHITNRNITKVYQQSKPAKFSVINYRALGNDKRVKQVEFPNNEKWIFNYKSVKRLDLPYSSALDEVVNVVNEKAISKYKFDCGYFFKNEIKNYGDIFDSRFARLCLKSLTKVDASEISLPVCKFGILFRKNYGENVFSFNDYVPPRLSFSSDWYGYYNNSGFKINGGAPCVNLDDYLGNNCPNIWTLGYLVDPYSYSCKDIRDPRDPYCKNGLLKSVINQYGGSLNYEYVYNTTNNKDRAGKVIGSGGEIVSKTIQYDGKDHTNDLVQEYYYINEDSTSSFWGSETPMYVFTNDLQVNTNSNDFNGNKNYKRFSGQASNALASFTLPTINGISTYFNTKNSKTNVPPVNSAKGLMCSFVQNLFFNLIINFAMGNNPAIINYSNVNFSYFPYNFYNPLPTQFSRVEVKNINAGLPNGKTIHEFTSNKDYPIDYPENNYPFINKSRCFAMGYGLPNKTTYYNKSNQKIKVTTNTYSVIKNPLNQSNNTSQSVTVLKAYSRLEEPPINGMQPYYTGIPDNAVSREYYYPTTGRIELIKTTDTIFNNNGNKIVSSTDYTYNAKNYLPNSRKSTDSKGKVIENKTYYPEDYTLNSFPVLQSMVNKNIVNTPVSIETWQTRPNSTPEILNTSVTEFGTISNESIKPLKSYSLQTDAPVAQNIIGVFNPAQLNRKPDMILPSTQFTYDAKGNPVQVNDLAGKRVSASIYGYDDRFVIANISNATKDEVAYTSFEKSLGTAEGNWDYTGVSLINNASSITGNKIAQLQNSSVKYSKAITKKTIVSLWSSEGNATVNGAAPVRTGPTINGWKYCEYEINSGINLVTISGTCKLDELRLYPKAASMATVAYEPSVGKTSECDINNRIVYYEYDGLGRIIKVKDENRNVIKTYEYHYKGQ
ncbi:MAG: hypothetical protein IPJ81_15065 [Chitinophagaceae bacterium]|nr:hypothetical protein [Chitinophagaceae bacterium]